MHNFLDFLREYKFEKFIPLFSVVIFLIYREFNRRSQRLIGVFFVFLMMGGIFFLFDLFGVGWAVFAFLGWLLVEAISAPKCNTPTKDNGERDTNTCSQKTE
jgi:hypothetical protein